MSRIGQSRDVVDRITQRADGTAGGECEGRRRAVNANHSIPVRGKLLEVAAVDEMDAPEYAGAARPASDVASPVEDSRIERMLLDQEVSVVRSVAAETFYDVGYSSSHVRKRRVASDLIVSRQ